jgi:hypothetical protein
MERSRHGLALALVASSVLLAPSAAVAQQTFSVLIDRDNSDATGCTVGAPPGPEQFLGADFELVTTVDTSVDPPEVTDLALNECTAAPSAWAPFAGPDPFTEFTPPWPAPSDPATLLDAIETYVPLSAIAPISSPIQLGFFSGPIGDPQDTLFTGQAAGPILLGQSIAEIPTLAEWSMLVLALLLLTGGLVALRRASRVGLMLSVLLLGGGLGIALAAAPHSADGLILDWTGHGPAATDALGDAPLNADIGQAFAHVANGTLFFRIDADCATTNAVDDEFTTDEDTQLTVPAPGVLSNDSDPDGDPLSAVLDTGPAIGTLVFNSDGSFVYTPNANFAGTDSFTYYAADTDGNDSNIATVTITIEPNPPPVAADDAYTTDEDTPLTVPAPGVLSNDSDPDGEPLSAVLDHVPVNGMFAFLPDGSFTYTPNANFAGSDSFTYHVTDTDGNDSTTATVTITVNPVPDPP